MKCTRCKRKVKGPAKIWKLSYITLCLSCKLMLYDMLMVGTPEHLDHHHAEWTSDDWDHVHAVLKDYFIRPEDQGLWI
jgi:hypothetical protein